MSKFNVGDKVRVAADAGSANGENNGKVFFGGEVEGVVVNVHGWGYDVEAPRVRDGENIVQSVGEEWLTLIEDQSSEVKEDAEHSETVEIEKLMRAADWLGSVGEHELRRIIKLAQDLA